MLREVKGLTLSDTGGKCGVRVGTLSCSPAPRPQNVIGEEGERREPSPSSASLAPTSSPAAATTVSKARGRGARDGGEGGRGPSKGRGIHMQSLGLPHHPVYRWEA